jgi:hypothetical protein
MPDPTVPTPAPDRLAGQERRLEAVERRLWSVERVRLVHAVTTAATRWRFEQVELDELTSAGRELVSAADALFAHRLTTSSGPTSSGPTTGGAR